MDATELHKLNILSYEFIEKKHGTVYLPKFYHGKDLSGGSWLELTVYLKPKHAKREDIEVSLVQILEDFDLRNPKQTTSTKTRKKKDGED